MSILDKLKPSKKHRESLLDILVVNYLYVKNFFKVKVFKCKTVIEPIDLNKFELSFHDDFKLLDDNFWRIGQPWGKIHPGTPHMYYGDESVSIVENGLCLQTKYYPRKNVTTWYDNTVFYNPDWSIGLVTSKIDFGYGIYEFNVTLPSGMGLWPALWMVSTKTYPPEIDLVEAYSNESGSYGKRLNTNCHFNFPPTQKESIGRNNHVNINGKVNFRLHFDENFIKFYYNGNLVRYIRDKKTIKWYKNERLMVIMNNSINYGYDTKMPKSQISNFIIHDFTFYSKI